MNLNTFRNWSLQDDKRFRKHTTPASNKPWKTKTAIAFGGLLMPVFAVLCLCFFALGCHKDPPEAILPDDIGFGESVVFLNGEKVDYQPTFGLVKFYNHMMYAFIQQDRDIINTLGFVWLPLKSGEFSLADLTKPNGRQANTSFGQIFDEDVIGYEYKLEDPKDGFLHIEWIDTAKMEVKGRFRAKFCRTTKNGEDDLGLPKRLLFQGVFYEKYEPF